jgi:hypothetical protein
MDAHKANVIKERKANNHIYPRSSREARSGTPPDTTSIKHPPPPPASASSRLKYGKPEKRPA